MPTYSDRVDLRSGAAVTRDESRAVFGQVMGLVALTVGCAALGAYIGRNLSGGTGILFFIGAFGYATRRDLSRWARSLFWALLALIVFGIVTIFVSVPHGNVIYSVLGLVVFGGFTTFDFYRLRRTSMEGAVPIAASIFLDIFNVFLFMLRLFGGGNRS